MLPLKLWGVTIPRETLTQQEIEYIGSLPKELPSVNWIWQEMDRIWEQYGLKNNENFLCQSVSEFYRHPIWLVNGIFTMLDPVSVHHRKSIARYISGLGVNRIADYGGGLGVLAREISRTCAVSVDIIEPFPRRYGIYLNDESGHEVHYTNELNKNIDMIIAQDVLEHVDEPMNLVFEFYSKLKNGGYLIFANCFFPVIKCHLPRTFHLRYTFRHILNASGLEYIGRIPGAEHALVFKKTKLISEERLKRLENVSKFVGPFINSISSSFFKIKYLFFR